MKDRSHIGITTREVPQILVQAILAYTKNPTLESYAGSVISIDGTILHVSKAVISHSYMEKTLPGQSFE